MKQFLKDAFIFLVPFIIIFVPAIVILARSGEFFSFPEVEEIQLKKPWTVFVAAYSNFTYEFKRDLIIDKKPPVIALGSSRTGQIRSTFFKNDSDFYNGGNAITALSDFKNFLLTVAPWKPRVIIMNLDPGTFDPSTSHDHLVRSNRFNDHHSRADVIVESLINSGGWWKVYVDLWKHNFILSAIARPDSIGLYSKSSLSGFLGDGSFHYGDIDQDLGWQTQVSNNIHSIAEGISTTTSYEYSSELSQEAFDRVDDFLAYCKKHNIYVIGFLSPIPHEVFSRMQDFPKATYAQSFNNLPIQLKKIYQKYGDDFFDFRDPESYGGSDQEMVNPSHGSEKLYGRLFLKMVKGSPALVPYADTQTLQMRLKQSANDYYLFSTSEF